KLLRNNLRKCCLVSLPLRFGPHARDRFAGRMNPDLTTVKHLDTANVEGMCRTCSYGFRKTGNPDAHQLTLATFFLLFFAKLAVSDFFKRQLHCGFVITAVIVPTQGALIREFVGWNKVFEPEFCRINLQLLSQNIHRPFDQVSSFRNSERTPIRYSPRGLVRVNTVYFAEGLRKIVGAGADVEKAGRKF